MMCHREADRNMSCREIKKEFSLLYKCKRDGVKLQKQHVVLQKLFFFSVEIASHVGQGGFSLELMNRGVMFAVSLVS